jgi:hypothetical protein
VTLSIFGDGLLAVYSFFRLSNQDWPQATPEPFEGTIGQRSIILIGMTGDNADDSEF